MSMCTSSLLVVAVDEGGLGACTILLSTRPCYGYLAIKYFGKYEYEATLTRQIDGVREYTRMPSEAARMYFRRQAE